MKDLSKIILLTDLDGTFLDNKSIPVKANLEAVGRFTDAGGKFAIASGRFIDSVAQGVPTWREIMNIPGIICNGAHIIDPKTLVYLCRKPMDGKIAYEICAYSRENYPDVRLLYTTEREFIRFGESENDRERIEGGECYKLSFVGDGAKLDEMRKIFGEKYGERLSYTSAGAGSLAILRHDATKGAAIEFLREYVGGDVTVYAVGDYENDIEMLMCADIPSCPKNSYPTVIDCVKRRGGHLLCDNNDGAIAELVDIIMRD